MYLTTLDQALQYIAWFLALSELTIGLYVLLLNIRHTANRYVSGLLLLAAANSLAVSFLIGAKGMDQARLPAAVFSATSAMIQPALLINAIVLLKPDWLDRNRPARLMVWVSYAVLVLPCAAVLSDWFFRTGYWFTGIDPATYTAGFLPLNAYTGGMLHTILQYLNFVGSAAVATAFLLYVLLTNNEKSKRVRSLNLILLFTQIIALAFQYLWMDRNSAITALATSTVLVSAYGFAAFQQMISERRRQSGRIRLRLTSLIVVVTIPMMLGVAIFVTTRAGSMLEENANELLQLNNYALAENTSTWIELQTQALLALAQQPSITGLDPEQQRSALQTMAQAHPDMYLVSTTDLDGFNLARSDSAELMDYSDRLWFQEARRGILLTYQTLIGRTSGVPALVVSTPLRNVEGQVSGVVMFASRLTTVTDKVSAVFDHAGGTAFIVDQENKLVAGRVGEELRPTLEDLSDYPPVVSLRQGAQGLVDFTDQDGKNWRSYLSTLDNGWGVVIQQPVSELLAPLRLFQRVSFSVLILGALMLFMLVWLTIRQGLQPIQSLTDTVTAITGGDLTREAPVESEDEFGFLARAFNSMTDRLTHLITDLEERVEARTAELSQRAIQLQVTAEVAREAAGIRELNSLLAHTVDLISERFQFYHAAIFLIDESGEFAVLRAANSEGGKRMLERGHRLRIGQVGIVGHAAAEGGPRIALDVGSEAVYFNNPDLPETHSEIALPMNAHGKVIGVLDVQSKEENAFNEHDVKILQVLADQIALAISNARLLSESQRGLQQLERLYGQQMQMAWQGLTAYRPLSFAYSPLGVFPRSIGPQAQVNTSSSLEENEHTLQVDIELRGIKLGGLTLRRSELNRPWSSNERKMVTDTITQVALALENARLFEEVQARAAREQTLNRITASISRSLDFDALLNNAVRELSVLPDVEEVSIHVGMDIEKILADEQNHPENGGMKD